MIAPVDRNFLSALTVSRTGIQVDPGKDYLIENRLAPVARREGFTSPADFVAAVRDRMDERLGWLAVEAMVQPQTDFFRDAELFLRLAGDVLPDMARARPEPLRVWVAACGGGQEVYSLAMLVAQDPRLAGRVQFFGSDISEPSLEKAQSGVYSQFEVQQGLPARLLVRCFEKQGDAFVVAPRVRQMIRWRRVNLVDDLTPLGTFDVILCRRVLGQMTDEARGRVLAGLRRALAPGGFLAVSPDETAGETLFPARSDIGLYATTPDALRSAA